MGPGPRTHPARRHSTIPSEKDRGRFPGRKFSMGPCPGDTGIFPIQRRAQHSGWGDSLQQQDNYPITTERTDPRHFTFCSSGCLLHDFQGGIQCFLAGHYTGYRKHESTMTILQTKVRPVSRMVHPLRHRSQYTLSSASARIIFNTRDAIT